MLVDQTHSLHLQIADLHDRRRDLAERRARKREELRQAAAESHPSAESREAATSSLDRELDLLERQVADVDARLEPLVAEHQARRRLADSIFEHLDETAPLPRGSWGAGDADDVMGRLL